MTDHYRRDGDETLVIEGYLEPDPPDWVYLPVEVPDGVTELAVHYSYDRPDPPPGAPENRLDIGIFDARGHDPSAETIGFRGWSGGARDSFRISPAAATPGYVPGPIHAGTWHIVLGPYTVAPAGLTYRVEVTLRRGPVDAPFVDAPAPTRARGRGRAWYRGDLHLHTVHSDGQWEPAELVAAVRTAGLDFMVSTEHNTSTAGGIWGRHAHADLLIIDGEEITTRNGHYVAAGLPPGTWIDWRYRARDGVLERYLDRIHQYGALAIAAHPFCPFVGCAQKFDLAAFDAVEVWNGPWTPDDEATLLRWDASLVAMSRAGRWLPAVGGSDSHHREQAVGLAQTVVLADELSRSAVLEGIRAGRAYVTGAADVEVGFRATAGALVAELGERLSVSPETEVRVELTLRGVEGAVVSLITDRGTIGALPLPASGEVSWTVRPRAAAYVRAEVRHAPDTPGLPGPMIAFTNPVFLGRSTGSTIASA